MPFRISNSTTRIDATRPEKPPHRAPTRRGNPLTTRMTKSTVSPENKLFVRLIKQEYINTVENPSHMQHVKSHPASTASTRHYDESR